MNFLWKIKVLTVKFHLFIHRVGRKNVQNQEKSKGEVVQQNVHFHSIVRIFSHSNSEFLQSSFILWPLVKIHLNMFLGHINRIVILLIKQYYLHASYIHDVSLFGFSRNCFLFQTHWLPFQ